MDHPKGAGPQRADRVDFDPRVRLEFRGAQISSDGGLLVMREMDDALGLSDLASAALCDNRRGKNTVHRLDGQNAHALFLAPYCHLYEDHQQRGAGEHLQPCQERWDVSRSDRTLLRTVPAVVEGDGTEPSKLWGVRECTKSRGLTP